MPEITERELTFAVEPGWTVPDLTPVLPDGGTLELAEHRLEAGYHDTDGHSLLGLGITLRRRTGGIDSGWHLKIPDGPARTEMQSGSRLRTPPKGFLALVDGVLDGQPLGVVATIRTVRRTHRILGADGVLVAELADDDVDGVATRDGVDGEGQSWREVEVELGPAGDEETLAGIGRLLTGAGAAERGTTTKLAHVLGLATPTPPDGLPAYVRMLCAEILLGEIRLRGEVDVEGVHDTRVAIRRLRSTLRVFTTLVEGTPKGLDDDLRWLAGLLGAVRDADVLTKHLDRKVDALRAELVLGPVKQELAATLASDRNAAIGHWTEARTGERYRRTLGAVAACHREPPVTEIRGKARRELGEKILRKAQRTARQRLADAGEDPTRVHRARKAVKRLRYTAEYLVPWLPRAAKTAKRAKTLQDVLGDHQDLVLEAAFLRRQGAQYGGREGHNGFAYGILLADAEQAAARILEDRPRW